MRNISLLISEIRSNLFPKFSGSINSDNILRNIVSEYKAANLSLDETIGLQSIEDLRKKLLQSNEVISSPVFGAGSKVLVTNIASRELLKDVARTSSKNKASCLLLYHLIKTYKPNIALELGTCLGISCAYQASALKHNTHGKIITIEGSPERAAIAKSNLEGLSLNSITSTINGKFEDILTDLLPELGFVDYAFIDGHHQQDATISYYTQLLPYFKKGGIMVFDDIFWSPGMNKAWKTIKNDGKFSAIMEYKGMGFGLITV